jgi:hypothetical protein
MKLNSGTARRKAQGINEQLETFASVFLVWLDEQIDKRLVRTFIMTVQAMITFRHNLNGLLLSELGGYLLPPAQAPAGTKRLSNLLRSPKWKAQLVERFLWQRATDHRAALAAAGEAAWVAWDESTWEKPESQALEGLSTIRSEQAARLHRRRPKVGSNPPQGWRTVVPGLEWVAIVVMGWVGAPTLAALRWWSPRGPQPSDKRTEESKLLHRCARVWGQQVTHLFDQGFAGSPWLGTVLRLEVRAVIRWAARYQVLNAEGREMSLGQLARRYRSLEFRDLTFTRQQHPRRTGLAFFPVFHPDYTSPLWIVALRPENRPAIYLLTTFPILSVDDAWRVALAYGRRWQLELTFRFLKTDLAFESPRVWAWETRLKLLMIVALAYAFLVSLLADHLTDLRQWLFRHWHHRTGRHVRAAALPLYRLRAALSRLWQTYPPSFRFAWENSG